MRKRNCRFLCTLAGIAAIGVASSVFADGRGERKAKPAPVSALPQTINTAQHVNGRAAKFDITDLAGEQLNPTHILVTPGEPATVRVMSKAEVAQRNTSAGGNPLATVYNAGESLFLAQPWGGEPCAGISDEWTFGNGAGPMGTNGGELVEYTVAWFGPRCILSTGGGCTALCQAGLCELCGGDGVNGGGDEVRNTPCANPYTVTVGLYDAGATDCPADPTTIGGADANLIVGTEATFTTTLGCCGDPIVATIDLRGAKVNVPGNVWVYMGVDRDDWGVDIGGIPNIGSSLGNGDWFTDLDSDGCSDTWSCFDAVGVFGCDGTPFGGLPCDWMVGGAKLTGTVLISMRPREAHLKPGDITSAPAPNAQIVGNEILLEKGGVNVWLDWYIGDYDPNDTGTQLRAYQIQIDSASYTTGLQGTLTPKLVPCFDAAGDVAAANAQCVAALGAGAICDFPAACPVDVMGACSCAPGFINTFHRNYTFPQVGGYPFPPIVGLGTLSPAVDTSTPNYRWAAAINAPPFMNDPGSCPGNGNFCTADGNCEMGTGPCALTTYPPGGMYAGTMVLDVSANAAGTFTISALQGTAAALTSGAGTAIPLVAYDPALITVQTGQCCDLTQDPFVCISDTVTANECVAAGGTTFDPTKTCEDDCGCNADNQCGDEDACTINRCDPQTSSCTSTPVALTGTNDCCDPTTTKNSPADLNGTGAQTDNANPNDCALEDCCDATGAPTGTNRGTACNPAADKGTLCDDGRLCTYDDECSGMSNDDAEACSPVGTEWEHLIDDVACNTSDDCLAATGTAWDCVNNFCRCVECAPLDFVITPGSSVNPNCFAQGEKITVDVVFGSAGTVINGGQFVMFYDPTCVQFNSISPGGDPYVTELAEMVDQAAGRIFYAVGVDPFGGEGVTSNGVLATASFTKRSGCSNCNFCFGGQNPQNTYLVDAAGQPKCVEGECSKELHQLDRITLDVPGNVKTNVDCDANTAIVTWDTPSATSSCEYAGCDPFKGKCYEASATCRGTHEKGAVYDDASGPWALSKVYNGGEFPIGVSTFCCVANSNICGDGDEQCWTVEVNDQTSLDVTVQLSPIITGDLTRCITFELWSDCVQGPYEFDQDLFFGGQFDHVGHYTDLVKIPDAGQWVCITARDQLHTLRACDFLECGPDGVYSAVFKGDPFFGGNWLIGGNIDAWKKKLEGANPSINVIDILDFGQFVANYGSCYLDGVEVACDNPGGVNGDTPCGVNGPHADINGDGTVDALDFSFITRNFMQSSKQCCCGPATADAGLTEISVSELRALGMADLAVADLNGDGLVNVDDMAAFMSGQGPGAKVPARDRKGSSSLRR